MLSRASVLTRSGASATVATTAAATSVVASVAPRAAAAATYASAASGVCYDYDEQQAALHDMARKFSKQEIVPVARHHDETGEYPWEIIKKAHELGLMNTHIPEEYGGLDLSSVESCIIAENISYGCAGIGTAIEGPNLAEAPLIVGGSDELKRKYLPRMVEEPLIAAYCVTEPGAGSDVGGAKTTAVRKGDSYILNGQKMWITGAGHANWLFVMAKTDSSAKTGGAFTGFIVDGDSPGLSVGKKEVNMGQRASDTRAVTFEDVEVPAENRIGDEGFGFKLAMKAFDVTRPEVGAQGVGIGQRALEESIAYALTRQTFGQPIAMHQAIAFMIAEMQTGVEASRLMVQRAAYEMDCGRTPTFYASMAKAFATENAKQCALNAVQIFGGMGYNTEAVPEKLVRDSLIGTIFEGTTQIQKLVISRTTLGRGSQL